MVRKIKVVDFFCGCGGASAGFRKAGMEIVLGVDSDCNAAESYKSNFPNASFIHSDVRDINPNFVLKQEPRIKEGPLLFAACAPCQPFSAQNKFKDSKDDRISLLDETHVFIRKWKPEFIFIENVPGMQRVSENEEGPFQRFTDMLKELKYAYKKEIVYAHHYGVPQKRKRLVIIASRIGEINIPVKTHGEGAKPYTTVADFIKGYPKLEVGQTDKNDPLHVAANMNALNVERIKNTPEGGDRRDWPDHLVNDCHKDYSGHTDTYGRMTWNALAPTLTTKCNSYSNGRFGHPDTSQNRAISIREASRLQTFPKSYKLKGTLVYLARQIGNAVPVDLAYRFGLEINSCIKKHEQKMNKLNK